MIVELGRMLIHAYRSITNTSGGLGAFSSDVVRHIQKPEVVVVMAKNQVLKP
jgi:hypothetical protein